METPSFKVSRAGVEIGTYELSRIQELVAEKKLLPTDHYWQSGMTGWKSLSALIEAMEINRREKREGAERAKLDEKEAKQSIALQAALERHDDKEAPFDIERILLILVALPFLYYGGATIINNMGRSDNFVSGPQSTAMTNGLLCFGIGVLLAKR